MASSFFAEEASQPCLELSHNNLSSMQESMKILDVRPPLEAEEVQNKYDFLFQLNDKSKGGSFYLQSKVSR